MARNTDETTEEKLAKTKNARKAITQRVGDRTKRMTRKSPGWASEGHGPFPPAEMSLVSTDVKHGAAKEVAVHYFLAYQRLGWLESACQRALDAPLGVG